VIDPLFLADGTNGWGVNIQFSGGFIRDFIEYCGK
jgi:hypothetical protein